MPDTPSAVPTVTPAELPDMEFDNVAQNTDRELNKLKKELGIDDTKTDKEHAEFLKIKDFFEANKEAIKKITHQELAQLKAAVMDENKELEGTLSITNDGAIDFKENTTSEGEKEKETDTESNGADIVKKDTNAETNTDNKGKGKEKTIGKMDQILQYLGKFIALIGSAYQTVMKFFNEAQEKFKASWAGFETTEQYKTFNALKGIIGTEMASKLDGLESEEKQNISKSIQEVAGKGKIVSSEKLKKIFEKNPFKSDATGAELANELIAHINKHAADYNYEEPKPTEGDTKKQEQEKRQKQGKDFTESVGKIMVDGKNITDIKMPENDIKGTDGNTKKYKKYGSETEFLSYTAQEFGKYTLWQLYNMKDVYDVKNTTEPKVQLINTVITYFEGLTKEQKDAEQNIPLNELLKKIPELTKPTDTPPVAGTETLVQPKGPEKTEKLEMRDTNNLVYANNKLWQWDGSNDFIEVYRKESGELARGADVWGASTLKINEKGLKIKVIPYSEGQTMVDAAISETNNPAKVDNSGYLWVPEGSFPADKLRDPK